MEKTRRAIFSTSFIALLGSVAFLKAQTPSSNHSEQAGIVFIHPDPPSAPLPQISAPASSKRHIESLGLAAGLWGSFEGGFEAWAYPFKLFDSLRLAKIDSLSGEASPLEEIATRQLTTPAWTGVTFHDDGREAELVFFTPRQQPGALLLLKNVSSTYELQFRTSLAPMLLDTEATPSRRWDENTQSLTVIEGQRKVALHLQTNADAEWTFDEDTQREKLILHPTKDREAPNHIAIAFAFSDEGHADGNTLTSHLLNDHTELREQAEQHYEELLASTPSIERLATEGESPLMEDRIRSVLDWGVVSLDQLRVRVPDLGHGLVSGYSSSGQGTRPKYCWFFEEPTLTSLAYLHLGMAGHVSESLHMLQRYQRADGKPPHEITQSLVYYPDYLENYPYAYMHTDGAVYFLVAYGTYYRRTGDLSFIEKEWPRIEKTYRWCRSRIDPEDGLIRIEPGDWGSAESSTAIWKDTQLEGMWVRALREMAFLARAVSKESLAVEANSMAEKATESIETSLWDEESGFHLWGIDRDGNPRRSLVPHHALSFWLSEFRADRVQRSLERLAKADFRTDWGVRSLALTDPKYDSTSYQSGSVWPVWNAGVMMGDFKHGRVAEGYRNWRSMIQLRTVNALGPMPEVLSGRRYEPLKECVPHQMFSEVATICGLFDGILGIESNVPENQLTIAPSLPPHWTEFSCVRLPHGSSTFDLELIHAPSHEMAHLRELRATITLPSTFESQLTFSPSLPAGCIIDQVVFQSGVKNGATENFEPIPFETISDPSSTRISATIPNPGRRVVIRVIYRGGLAYRVLEAPLKTGENSKQLCVIKAHRSEDQWRMSVQGLTGEPYLIAFYSPHPAPENCANGRVVDQDEGWFMIETQAPNGEAVQFAQWKISFPWP